MIYFYGCHHCMGTTPLSFLHGHSFYLHGPQTHLFISITDIGVYQHVQEPLQIYCAPAVHIRKAIQQLSLKYTFAVLQGIKIKLTQ